MFGFAREKGKLRKIHFPWFGFKVKKKGEKQRRIIYISFEFDFSFLCKLGTKQKERKNYALFPFPHVPNKYDVRSSHTFFMYFSTSQGTCERLLKPPNAVPFQTRPVTNWKGRVLISWPEAATPTITEVPHPWSYFDKIRFVSGCSNVKSQESPIQDNLPCDNTPKQISLQRHFQCTQNCNQRHHP